MPIFQLIVANGSSQTMLDYDRGWLGREIKSGLMNHKAIYAVQNSGKWQTMHSDQLCAMKAW
jgi:hypothetical protein